MSPDIHDLNRPILGRDDALRMVNRHLADPESAWSIGGLGAIAEFARDGETQPVLTSGDGAATIITSRGAIRINLPRQVTAIARERQTECHGAPMRETMFCLPEADSVIPGQSVLTELGPDKAALRNEDRDAVIFDLGLDFPHMRACVRTKDADCAALLRTHRGRSVLDPDNALLKELRHFSPHRVFYSALGRIEVYAGIPGPGETSPRGPHTHVMSGVLRRPKPTSADHAPPAGLRACLSLYPGAAETRPS